VIQKINEFLKDYKYFKATVTILFLVALILIYKNDDAIPDKAIKTVSVVAVESVIKKVPIYISAIGTVTPYYTANIQPQVTGRILGIKFKEGQKVKKNDVLVEIDPAAYQAQVTQYEGQLERDKAIYNNANIDLKRYKELWKEKSISSQTLATQEGLVQQYKGTVKMDEGYLEAARVNLDFCKIRAPFDGLMGIALLTEGALVSSATNIAVINVVNPISVLFNIQDIRLEEILQEFRKEKKMLVEVFNRNKNKFIKNGELNSIDNQINISTGTIQLRARFNNDDLLLYPNQFVNVKLLIQELNDAVTVPVPAIQYGPDGAFVYKIIDEKATIQPVFVEVLTEGEAVIKSGLEKDELVVIIGGDRLTEGTRVSLSKGN
jgi:membrane fusion protein, multidrug efflux system